MALSDDIKARLDIVDVVAGYVPELKRAGRNYTARCPFHQERTPSFVVFPERQTWRCFGACATGGDVFGFVMRAENLDFPAALRTLGERVGIRVPDKVRREAAAPNPIFSANEAALRFFRDALQADRGALARDYVRKRGIGDQAVVDFGVGYSASTGDDLKRHLEALGFSPDLLVSAGLVTRGDTGTPRDMFRGRLMVPIRDADGRIVGFGGRSLDGSDPKYLNTPQTPVFDKGRVLYAMDRARDPVTREGRAVVVEGYMDAIAAHEHGYRNVVASMGTALTQHQVELLRGRAQRIVLALDPDAAGQEATLRSLRTSWRLVGEMVETARSSRRAEDAVLNRPSDIDALRVAVLPDGLDPDELIRRDAPRWRKLIDEAVPAVEFLMQAELRRLDVSTPAGKAQAAERILPVIYAIPNWAEQDAQFQRLASLLGVAPSTLEASVGRRRRGNLTQRRRAMENGNSAAPRESTGVAESLFRQAESDALEEHALALVLHYPELLERVGEVSIDHVHRAENKAVLSAIQQAGTIENAYSQLEGDLAEHLDRLMARVLPPSDRTQRSADFDSCLRRIEERFLRELKAEEEAALTQAFSDGTADSSYLEAVQAQALATNERLRQLFTESALQQ